MTRTSLHPITIGLLLLVGVAAPLLFPAYTNQIAVLWLMIVFAMTWDTLGGQMGYNSLGNIFFFGAGMYTCAVVQIGLYYDVGMYTSGARTTHIVFTTAQYFTGFAFGVVAAGIMAAILAVATSWVVFGLRGPYFAIGTLGVAVAGAELVASWQWVGAASGISMPVFPGAPQTQKLFFYFLLFALAFVVLLFLRWLYSTNFGMAINAIRDDEEKAEAMGLYTRRYKRTAWTIAAFFLGIAGAIFGNMIGFIDARDIAFPTTTFQYFHDSDGAARWQGHVLGTGGRCGCLPRHQGGDLDLFSRLAVRDARPAHRDYCRLLPAGHRRLVDGEISGTVWSPCCIDGARSAVARDQARTTC